MFKSKIFWAAAVAFVLLLTANALADWSTDDPYKMHYPQLPDPRGWDVSATNPVFLADDWTCSESGYITDIHFWGSWRGDDVGQIVGFYISIHADIPDPNPEDPMTHSMPDDPPLWEFYTEEYTILPVAAPSLQGWLDAAAGEWYPEDHLYHYQYNLFFERMSEPPSELFFQEIGTIYWLNISAVVTGTGTEQWGWKSSTEHHQDDAVWAFAEEWIWQDLYESPYFPYMPGDVDGNWVVNQADVDCLSLYLMGGQCLPAYCLGGYCPAGDVNGDCLLEIDDLTALGSYVNTGGPIPTYCQDFLPITEAQSLDLAFVVNGEYFEPTGACCYSPTGGPDLEACIVTTKSDCETNLVGTYQGDGTTCGGLEACCLADNSCVMVDALCCVNELGGTPQGPQSSCGTLQACCLPDYTCVMADDVCCVNELGGVPQGIGSQCESPVACCFPDGSCQMLDPNCCDEAGGTPSPYSTVCLGDNDLNGTDDGCELPPSESKWLQPPDLSDNGMDVNATFLTLADDFLCQLTGPVQEIHIYASWLADIVPTQPDNVTFRLSFHSDIPADPPSYHSRPGQLIWERDFRQGDYKYEIVNDFINEWWYDPATGYLDYPGDHVCWKYTFIIEEDPFIQEGTEQDPTVYWLDVMAIPGQEAYFGWKTTPVDNNWNDDAVFWNDELQDWSEMVYPPGHPNETRSINLAFELFTGASDTCAGQLPGDVNNNGSIGNEDIVYLTQFLYGGGPTPPVMSNADPNGDCWVDDEDIKYLVDYLGGTGDPPVDCTCLNPTVCDCKVGDANGDGSINIGDEVYIENIVFRPGSPAPQPYPVCNGDANFDCGINIGDAVFIGNIVFRPGSPLPPYCHDWAVDPVKGCGYPVYKK